MEDKTAPQPIPNLDAATYLDAQSPDGIPSLVTGDQIPSPPSADNVYDQEIQVTQLSTCFRFAFKLKRKEIYDNMKSDICILYREQQLFILCCCFCSVL